MPSFPSIVVIGAGVAGLTAALRAAELGCDDVTVLERDAPASGSSGLSAGVFNITTVDALNLELRIRSRETLAKYQQENGLELHRIGYIRLARTEEHLDLFREAIEIHKSFDIDPARLITSKQMKDLVPDLRVDDLLGGLHSPLDGHMDGHQLCGVLWERARPLGVKLHQATRVIGAETGRTRRHRLQTSRGEFEADIVINAAGPWAAQVGELLGTPVPLLNQVHHILRVRPPRQLDYVMPMVNEYVPGFEEGAYFRQEGPAELIGATHTYAAEETTSADPDHYAKTMPWNVFEVMAGRIADRLPIEDLGFAHGWTGLYPVSVDDQFQVGPYESDPSVLVVGGFGGVGLCTAISLAPLAAEWAVLGKPATFAHADQFLPDRPSLAQPPAGVAEAVPSGESGGSK